MRYVYINTYFFCNLALRNVPLADNVHISAIDFDSRQLKFSWSPVAPDCPAIHYNILASNCGSCPTTTNHTNVTCTNIPSNSSSKCTFAVQTVACGNITGNTSEPLNIVFYKQTRTSIDSLHPTDSEMQGTHILDSAVMVGGMDNSDLNTVAYTVSLGFLIVALIVCVVVSIIMIAVVWRRSKAKINAALETQSHGVEGTMGGEPMYEDVTGPLQSVGAINTQDNVAYGHGHTKTATLKESQH